MGCNGASVVRTVSSVKGEGPGRGEPITHPSDLVMNLDGRDGETEVEGKKGRHTQNREREHACD